MAAGHRPCSRKAAVACGSSGPDRIRPRHTWCPVRGGCREDYLSTLVAGLRSAGGHRPGRQSAADTGMASDTGLATCAGH
jgi:hypothetical protein